MAHVRRDDRACSCSVEAVVSVDGRGQMVLPKEIRERANLSPGDRLAVVFWEKEGDVCCITLIKADHLTGMVKSLLSPMMEEIADGRDPTA
ncbi:AbrB/MazE/SpoVT family DNA-binding domain-containing protein [Methanoculleus sp. FWC-SCC1]|uniref:AbrB/MazE/SpoVT family DNA-binding domain-containing protein n=1 Tax=Methanoculleus frigidifontis TaxID=2584085 RepID=A0ABT8MDE3_9EURY|nr:HgcAB-associated protein [Methanoculleus sp. FWC-SCC1]MDN7025963.1 AbrB/MazE/SpoVT family DNA-binding domain-containing protein [Methanoculleus sp. FWC-SCC1]